jgi:ketosteroid isomerase-like protein
MTQENVEVVRLMLAAWNDGDMDGVRELWHPNAIVRPAAGWPEPGPFVGREAVMQSFRAAA